MKKLIRKVFGIVLLLVMFMVYMPVSSTTIYADEPILVDTITATPGASSGKVFNGAVYKLKAEWTTADGSWSLSGTKRERIYIYRNDAQKISKVVFHLAQTRTAPSFYASSGLVTFSGDDIIVSNIDTTDTFVFYSNSEYYIDFASSVDIYVNPHTCSETEVTEENKIAEQASTCTANGWSAYWICSCGKVYAPNDFTKSYESENAWKTGDGKIAALGHDWEYVADGATITASCSRKATCGKADVSLTLSASNADHSGIENLSAFNTATKLGITESDVEIYKVETAGATSGGEKITGVPTKQGNYYASLTVGGQVAVKAFELSEDIEPLTFTAIESSVISFYKGNLTDAQYKKNDEAWTDCTRSSYDISMDTGDIVQFRASLAAPNYSSAKLKVTGGGVEASGDVTSLLNGVGGDVDLSGYGYYGSVTSGAGVLYQLFRDSTALITAPNLPSTKLSGYCYRGMFVNCSNLIEAPTLPAIELTDYCYNGMFQNCTSLENAPELPATSLAINCYESMFHSCSNLKTAPELPAPILKSECYSTMFVGCTSLERLPNISATTLANKSCYGMFINCTGIGLKNSREPGYEIPWIVPATTSASSWSTNIFNNLTDVPSQSSVTNNKMYYQKGSLHNFRYSTSGATLKAECDKAHDATCTVSRTLTITADDADYAEDTPYDGLSFGDGEKDAWDDVVGDPIIEYVGRGKTSYDGTTAPTNIGRYTVKVYPAAEEDNPTHVATANFNILDAHDWRYSADGNKIEAYCANEGCPSETDATHKASLTLNAEPQNYSDKVTYSATLDNASAWEALGLTVPTIKYFKATSEGGTDGDEEVTNLTGLAIGNYYATITVGDVTAKKAFKIILVDGEFTVEFVNKGNVVKTISKVKANSLLAELKLSAPGFVGWYKEAEGTTPWDFDTDTITADTKLYAKYVDTVTVTLNANGGTFAEGTETTHDIKIGRKLSEKTLNEIGSKAKYGAMVFSGWYKDEDCATPWDFKEDVVTEATTLYIGWGYPAGHEETAELSVTKVRDYTYTGKKITPAVSVSFGGRVLVPGVDYTVTYKNNIKAYTSVSVNNLVIKEDGSIDYSNVDTNKAPTIIIKGKKNYTNKTIALNFNILPVSLGDNADSLGNGVSADINDYYAVKKNGAIKVKGIVAYNGKKLSAKNYSLKLIPDNAIDADGKALPKEELAGQKIPKGASGTFKLTVAGKDNYKDGFVKTITVKENAKTLEKAKISTKKIEYSGHDLTVEEVVDAAKGKLTVKIAGKTLTYGTDYEVTFADQNAKAGSRTNCGVYPIVINAKGEYVGSRMGNVTVTGILIKKAVVSFEETSPVYTGSHIGANIKSVSINSVDKTVSLTEGIDYDVVVKNDVKAGKANVTITGKGIYSGTKKVSYKIQKKKLTNEMFENVTISDNAIYLGKYDYYGGVAITPDVSISYNGMNLINPADYSISYKNNKKAAGTAKAVIKGKGNYTGSVGATFTIGEDKINNEKINIKKAKVKVADQIYTGRAITISANEFERITIAGKEGNLTLGKDFEIIERSYTKNVNVGKAQFVIKGINDYDGYKLVTFRITKKDLKWWQKLFQ